MMELEGGGLYFVEGVLATIEVKSIITSQQQLTTSLENCQSVLMLSPLGEHPTQKNDRINFYMKAGNLKQDQAEQRFWYNLAPATYIFAFNSNLSLDTTCECIGTWWNSIGCARSKYFPLLPRVVTSGSIVGVVNNGRMGLTSTVDHDPVMSLFSTARRFRWFALHLMDVVSTRLGLRNFAEQCDYRLTDYYPLDEYIREVQTTPAKFISRP
jgi:hypothetical protein